MTLLPLVTTGGTSWMMYAGIGAVGLGLLGLLVLMVPFERKLSTEERVQQYAARAGSGAPASAPVTVTSRPQESALQTAKDVAATALSHNVGLEQKIARRLDAAGSQIRPAEWLMLHAAVFIGVSVLGLIIGGGNLIVGLIFMGIGALGPSMYLRRRARRRKKRFESALPDTLQLMSGSLAAGLSLAQSVDTIVREANEPIASEFKRVLVETRLGLSLEDALQGIADRFQSEDFDWVVMAINIQRQVGGNLAELLNTVAGTMREREYIRRQVAALAAEGKLSAYVLGGLPPGFMLYLLLANRPYVIVLFQRPLGWLMIGAGVVILSVGVFWMSRIVKVEV
ncbi:type II secretion system F family protein [Nocardioides cynanchi]|uniref:type II secretion system F family protein n=1 Tax=Nocardioides cynanchi TaxID=2558918 RepID=UPI001243DEE6|nr:type II secretion system F family protein [Nocardioides cynanchi]